MDAEVIQAALRLTGERLRLNRDVEILLVGGAAGILTKELPPPSTTGDVDAIWYKLAQDREAVLDAAGEVGREMQLPGNWLNDWSGLYRWTLPDGWETRRVCIDTYGRLLVYAVSRIDLISLKFVANREGDLEHLREMHVTAAEITVVGRYLDELAGKFPRGRFPEEAGKIDKARVYLGSWETGNEH